MDHSRCQDNHRFQVTLSQAPPGMNAVFYAISDPDGTSSMEERIRIFTNPVISLAVVREMCDGAQAVDDTITHVERDEDGLSTADMYAGPASNFLGYSMPEDKYPELAWKTQALEMHRKRTDKQQIAH